MQRRHFLHSALAAAAGASSAAFATLARPAASGASSPDFSALARPAGADWRLGYEGLGADVEPTTLALRGRLPAGLRGALYRNGPARHAFGGVRYRHPFDGDGLVQRYDLTDAGVAHRGRFVRTEKFVAEARAGRLLREAFGTHPPGMEATSGPDALNVANTNVLQRAGALYALWEGGSAIALDARTLETLGPKAWSPELAGMPFSAHPRVEPDGSLWNFGVSSHAGKLTVYRVASDGRLLGSATLDVPQVAMVHDFAVTERHLVFLLPPLVFDVERARAGATFLASHVWRPELGLRVLLLPKDDLARAQWLELPAGMVFHLGNAWEEAGSGVIRLDCMRAADAWHATEGLLGIMAGRYEQRERARSTLITLDPRRGRATQEVLPHVAEFPRVDPRVVGRAYRRVFSAARVGTGGARPGYDAVMRLDMRSGAVDRYVYGDHVMVEEHVFVPRAAGRGREGDGWLVGTALDLQRRATLLSVFDARRLADGPVAQASMPRVMPLGLHGTFVAARS